VALDHAALLEVLEAMKVAGVDERVKVAAQTIYQALIDTELTSVIGAGPWEHTVTGVSESQRSGREVVQNAEAGRVVAVCVVLSHHGTESKAHAVLEHEVNQAHGAVHEV